MDYQIVYEPTQQDILDVRAGLRKFNDPFVDHLNECTVGIYAVNAEGERAGGVVARLWGNWMHVMYLWVDPASKGAGIGTALMTQLEQEAIAKGCKSAMVDTFSFQARPFYEKLGYQCRMSLDDVPGDSLKIHFLTKQLAVEH